MKKKINIAVIYKSKYGATKQYAEWIAEELNAELLEHNGVSPADLQKYDLIIYGGGLYAGGISGIDLVVKNPVKGLIVFTVGLANPESTDYTEILQKSIPTNLQKNIKVFHLRGGMNYKELGIIHRGMMAIMKKMFIDKKAEDELTEDDKAFIETYGDNVSFIDRITIAPLLEYVINNL